jgi:hypothetical protein
VSQNPVAVHIGRAPAVILERVRPVGPGSGNAGRTGHAIRPARSLLNVLDGFQECSWCHRLRHPPRGFQAFSVVHAPVLTSERDPARLEEQVIHCPAASPGPGSGP